MNRKQFLSQLLRTKNNVHKDEDQECMICKEEYGTRSPEGETVERQIRLPCNSEHAIQSTRWVLAASSHGYKLTIPVRFQDDEDLTDGGEDTDDEDFIDECGETDEEDVNMSDEDEGMTDAGCQEDDYDEKDDDDDNDDDE